MSSLKAYALLGLAVLAVSFATLMILTPPAKAVIEGSHKFRLQPKASHPGVLDELYTPAPGTTAAEQDEFCGKCHSDKVLELRTGAYQCKKELDCYYCHEKPHMMLPIYCSDCHPDEASAIGEDKLDVHWTMTYPEWGYEEHYPTHRTTKACVACHTVVVVSITKDVIHTLNYTLTWRPKV